MIGKMLIGTQIAKGKKNYLAFAHTNTQYVRRLSAFYCSESINKI